MLTNFKIPIFNFDVNNTKSIPAFLEQLFSRWNGSNLLRHDIFELPSWDMQATSQIQIEYRAANQPALNTNRIMGTKLMINDDNGLRYDAAFVHNGIESIVFDPTTKIVTINRVSGGFFDSAIFSTSANRGVLTLDYIT